MRKDEDWEVRGEGGGTLEIQLSDPSIVLERLLRAFWEKIEKKKRKKGEKRVYEITNELSEIFF